MIAAPYVTRNDRAGKPVAMRALVPVPVFGLSDWNRKLLALGKKPA